MAKVIGADKVMRNLSRLKQRVEARVLEANRRTASDMVRIAKVVHPGDGETRADITSTENADGSILVDFGSKAKVTEGDSGPRPYVNPTLAVIRKKMSGRYRRAIRLAVKDAFGG